MGSHVKWRLTVKYDKVDYIFRRETYNDSLINWGHLIASPELYLMFSAHSLTSIITTDEPCRVTLQNYRITRQDPPRPGKINLIVLFADLPTRNDPLVEDNTVRRIIALDLGDCGWSENARTVTVDPIATVTWREAIAAIPDLGEDDVVTIHENPYMDEEQEE